ncbi:hypothetical protein HK096_006466 [Nowakowskiella sp. JEL0078]|nr:hypothetical protein HK096_006466 [Nowakowskiella sp. JEL0078]
MVALDGNPVPFTNTTLANGSFVLTQTGFIGPWDLMYFILFNRFLVQFDIPTLLIMFIDGFTWKKRVAFCLILHWVFRSLGGVMFGVIKFSLQANIDNIWRYTTGIPTLPWYLGELFLDSYPFQKAWALAGSSKWLKILAAVGFIPLVLYKIAIVIFRYYFTFKAASSNDYFKIFNYLDAGAITLSSWNDLWSCFVISRKLSDTEGFLSNLVQTTELRIVVCTVLSIISAVLMFQEGCIGDIANSQGCTFANVRSIAIDIVYGLYYLDYLIIKYYKIVSTEKTKTPVDQLRNFNQIDTTHKKYPTEIDLEMTNKSNWKPLEIGAPYDFKYRNNGNQYTSEVSDGDGSRSGELAISAYQPQGETYALSNNNAVPRMQYSNLRGLVYQQNQSQIQSTFDNGSNINDSDEIWNQNSR